MVLKPDESYITNNGKITNNVKTTVIQGEATPEQQTWFQDKEENPALGYLTLTPAQILYIALCKNGFKLQEALESCGLDDAKKLEAQRALKILDDRGNLRVNERGIVTQVTRPCFFGANLRGRDLQGADLRGASLWYADLRDANLQGADLRDAGLYKAQMQGADLRGRDLRGANLQEADLQEADLRETNLRGASLWYADLRDADLRGADL
ncbi:MAG: pentapeptide repeat-containing protein, partial [Alphaproteobacteria bacterium]|nr:pentapeptide repeat-containing protein [Alphaproteobacteria bacterium]